MPRQVEPPQVLQRARPPAQKAKGQGAAARGALDPPRVPLPEVRQEGEAPPAGDAAPGASVLEVAAG